MSGSIRKRGRRSWQVQLELGRDPVTGRRLRHFVSVKGTKKDAERVLNDAIHQRDTGIDLRPERMTVGAYLERWLTDYVEHNVAASTRARYHEIVRKHLTPALGLLGLSDLRPAHIQHAYARWLSAGLAPRTVIQHHRVLHKALEHAVRWQLLSRNPAHAVAPPRPSRAEMRALDQAGVARLLRAATGTPVAILIQVALATGARQGELLALRWSDVDLRCGEMRILRTARFFPGQGILMTAPKTSRSRRPVALSRETCKILRLHRLRQHRRRQEVGELWDDHGLVFPSEVGTPMYARNLARTFQRVVAAAGLAPLRFHDLRHTAATLMLGAGIHPKIVSERLGHASVSITLDTYSHVLPEMQQEAATALDRIMGRG